ncbi:hypothetical protein [Actinomadura sp. NTSP31]|uniref:hypothetical protein n=1 Tax=Actinomadura sp. NTSP31 TaxID=1735447 RepID=UPI0035C11A8C
MLIDEPVSAETTPAGHPSQITGARGCFRVRRVLEQWQEPGAARFYRLQIATPDGPAIAEVVGPPTDSAGPWTLRRIWP